MGPAQIMRLVIVGLSFVAAGGCGGLRPIAEFPVNVGRRVLVDLPVGLAKDITNALVETVTGWKPFKDRVPAPVPEASAPPPAPSTPQASSPEARDTIALEAARRADVRFRLTAIGIVGGAVMALMLLWAPTRAFAFPTALGFSGLATVIVVKLALMDLIWLALFAVVLLALYLLGLLIITAIGKRKAEAGKEKVEHMLDAVTDGVEASDPAVQKVIEEVATAYGVEDDLHEMLAKKGYAKPKPKPPKKKKG